MESSNRKLTEDIAKDSQGVQLSITTIQKRK